MASAKLIFSIVGIIILLGLIGSVLLFKNITQKPQVAGLDTPATPQKPTSEELAQQILYSSNPEGNYEIYQMSLKDKKPVNLTQNSADDMNPQLSPDGDLIVFYSNRSGSNQIYQMSLETKAVKQLTNSPANDYDPSFSPDGSKIVFKSTRDDKLGDIFVMDSDGSNEENLTRKRTKTEEWDPTFSADGSKIIFVVRSGSDDATDELFSMNSDGSEIKQLTKNKIVDWYPSINPRTGQILFISRDDDSDSDDLYQMNEDGEGRERIISLIGNDADPAWDQNGEKIVFIRENDTNYDLFIMNADGSSLEKILETDADELSPIFLPLSS